MKKLIINPTEQESTKLTMLSYGGLIRGLVKKVFQRGKDRFSPVTLREHHIGLFINNVEPKLVAANLLVGKVINDFDEAQLHLNELGKKIYETKYWITKVISNEIFVDRNPNAQYGFISPDPELTNAIQTSIEDFCTVEVRQFQVSTEDQPQTEQKQEQSKEEDK